MLSNGVVLEYGVNLTKIGASTTDSLAVDCLTDTDYVIMVKEESERSGGNAEGKRRP